MERGEKREPAERAGGDASFRPTRRVVLGGSLSLAASRAIAGGAQAASPDLKLAYRNDLLRDVVELSDETAGTLLLAWKTSAFGRDASFEIGRESRFLDIGNEAGGGRKPEQDTRQGRYVPVKLTLIVRRASLPGPRRSCFTMTFTVARADPGAPWTIALTAPDWWDGRNPTTFGAVDLLRDFVKGSARLAAELPASRAGGLVRGFFGDRIETRGAIRLELDRNLVWRLTPKDGEGEFYALHVFLTFRSLTVRRVHREDAGEARASSRPSEDRPAEARPLAQDGFCEADWLAFDEEAAAGSASGETDGLYGVIGDIRCVDAFPRPAPETRRGGACPARMGFELGSFEAGGAALSIRLALDAGIPERIPTQLKAALRHWGDPRLTAARCVFDPKDLWSVGDLVVTTRTGERREETVFKVAHFEITRQFQDARSPVRAERNRILTRFRFRPQAKEHRVETPFAGFDVSALPALGPAPGSQARVPAIEVETVDVKESRKLARFGAFLALQHVGYRLPERIEDGAERTEDGKAVFGSHTSRLDFDEAEAFFRIPGLKAPEPRAADAVIAIGLPDASAPAAEIALDRARLTVIRPTDLLALKFRFAGLVLAIPSPDALASLAPRGGRAGCRAEQPAGRHDPSGRAVPTRDERPLLVVEFPPQHVLERAYYRQLPAPVTLPVVAAAGTMGAPFEAALAVLRGPKRLRTRSEEGTTARERIAARRRLLAAADPSDGALMPFVATFRTRTAQARLPREQRIYAGDEFLDPDARRIALRILGEAAGPEAASGTPPEPALDAKTRERFLTDRSKAPLGEDALDGAALAELALAKDRLSSDFAAFRVAYAGRFATLTADEQKQHKAYAQYLGAVWFETSKAGMPEALRRFVETSAAPPAEDFADPTEARLSGPSRIAFRVNCDDFQDGRSGGRIPFSLEGLTNWAGMDMAVVRRAERLLVRPPRGPQPPRWQRSAATDEGDILAFQGISRADRDTIADERRQAADLRVGRHALSPRQRLAEVHAAAGKPPDPFETALELPARLFLSPAQDATWKTPSAGVHRAVAQANASGGQANASGAQANASGAEAIARSLAADRAGGPSELWTARIDGWGGKEREATDTAGLRAIWSPDFRPEALLSTDLPGAPPKGPWRAWSIARTLGIRSPSGQLAALVDHRFRTGLDAYDRHELVILSSVHGLPVLGRRGADRKIVEVGKSQIEPPPGFRLAGLASQGDKAEAAGTADFSAIYKPAPLTIGELALSALGGSIELDTAFQPPAPARFESGGNLFDALAIERWRQRTILGRDITVEVVYKGYLFPIGHRASLVKLTERMFLDISGTRNGPPVAVLVQRKFLQIGQPEKRFPAQGQPNRCRRWPAKSVTIVTKVTPDLVDPDEIEAPESGPCPAADGGAAPASRASLARNGRITFTDAGGKALGTGQCFWPRVARRAGSEVWFQMRMEGEAVPVRMPLIFVDNAAANDPPTMQALVAYYNRCVPTEPGASGSPTRRLDRRGQPVVMAPPAKPNDTTYETTWWDIAAEGRESVTTGSVDPYAITNGHFERDAFMEGLDQPAFYPFVAQAECRLTQVERFSGGERSLHTVGYDPYYVINGFSDDPNLIGGVSAKPLNQADAFLVLTEDPRPLAFGARGDLAGGVAHPTMTIGAISRSLGPLGLNEDARTQAETEAGTRPRSYFKPTGANPFDDRNTFFEKVFTSDAKFLGIVKLSAILNIVGDLVGQHPKLLETVEYGSRALDEGASDARALLIEGVVRPAEALVERVTEEWRAVAGRSLSLGAGGRDSVSLSKAFPEVGGRLEALGKALKDALVPGTGNAAFIASLARIHEAAQGVIRTIDTIASDPLAAISDEQLGTVRTLKARFDGLLAGSQAIVKDWRCLPQTVFAAIARDVTAESARRVRRFVVTLPVPPLAEDVRASVDAAIDAALRRSLGRALGRALSDAPGASECEAVPADLAANLRKFPEDFAREIRTEIDRSGLAEDAKTALETFAARLANDALTDAARIAKETIGRLEPTTDRLRAVCEGIVKEASYRFVSPALMRITETMGASTPEEAVGTIQTLVSDLRQVDPAKDPARFLEALGRALHVLGKLFGGLALADLVRRTPAACGHVRAGLSRAVEMFLPSAADIERLAACVAIVKRADAAPTGACQVSAAVSFSRAALSTLRGVGALVPALPEAARGLIEADAKALIADANLVAEALAGLAEARRDLTRTLAVADDACTLPAPGLVSLARALDARQRLLVAALHQFRRDLRKTAEDLKTTVLDPDAIAKELKESARAALADLVELTLASARAVVPVTILKAEQAALAALGATLRDLATALPEPLADLKSTVAGLAGEVEALARSDAPSSVAKRLEAITKAADAADAAVSDLRGLAIEEVASRLGTVLGPLDALAGRIDEVETEILAKIQSKVFDLETRILTQAQAELDALLGQVAGLLAAPLTALSAFYDGVIRQRGEIETAVLGLADPIVVRLLDELARQVGASQGRSGLFRVQASIDGRDVERLEEESGLAGAAAKAAAEKRSIEALTALGRLGERWSGKPALVLLVERFGQVDATSLRRAVVAAIDFGAFRNELEALIRELVPTRARLSYDLSTGLKPFPSGKPLIVPEADSRFTLSTTTEVDLLRIGDPKATVRGSVGAFKLVLLPQFEAIILTFHGLAFTAGSGQEPDFDVRFGGTKIGEKAKFLEQLQAYLSPKGAGLKVGPLEGTPGIEASYGINLGCFGVGTLSFSNVVLFAGARLPFKQKTPAEFVVSIGRPDAPFLISSTIFGGGGYLALTTTGQGFKALECSFDYGGVVAFGFGPLQGSGQVTLGVYLRQAEGTGLTLGATFMARGSASIACFGFSTSLFVRLTNQGGRMRGEAVYSFSFSYGIGDIEFSVRVSNDQGTSMGRSSPTGQSGANGLPPWGPTRYAALPEPSERSRPKGSGGKGGSSAREPHLRVKGVSQRQSWTAYRARYFDPDLRPEKPI